MKSKTAIVILQVLSLTLTQGQASPQNSTLAEDFADFKNAIPQNEIRTLFMSYAVQDEEFQEVWRYLIGSKERQELTKLDKIPEIKAFFTYLQNNGVGIFKLQDKVYKLLRLGKWSSIVRSNRKIIGHVSGFLRELEDAIPMENMKQLFEKKRKESQAFQRFVAYVASLDLEKIAEKVLKEIPNISKYLEGRGVNVKHTGSILVPFVMVHAEAVW